MYSMTYAASSDSGADTAVVVPPDPVEDAVRFINLQRYPAFFDDMDSWIPCEYSW